MALEMERVEGSGRKKGVASYIELLWEEWLQDFRVELNAMSTPQFLTWLEEKIRLHDKGKVIPPTRIMEESLDQNLQDKLDQKITAEILKAQHYEDQVAEAVRQVKERCSASRIHLGEREPAELKKEPVRQWKDVVEDVSEEMIKNYRFCEGTHLD